MTDDAVRSTAAAIIAHAKRQDADQVRMTFIGARETMSPDAFERLIHLLRKESNAIQLFILLNGN